MKELDFDNDSFDVEDDFYEDEEDNKRRPSNRYRVLVELVIKADSADDAADDAKLLIDGGVIALMDNEDRSPLVSYDVSDSFPEEL